MTMRPFSIRLIVVRYLLIARPWQLDGAAAAHFTALLVDPLRNGEVRGGGAVVVGVERDLLIACTARKASIENLTEFVNLVPGDDPLLNSDLLISDGCDWSGVIAKLFANSMRPTRKAG